MPPIRSSTPIEPIAQEQGPYTCCGQTFTRERDLVRHRRSVEPHVSKSSCFKCEACGTTCARRDTLKRHQKNPRCLGILLYGKNRRYKCSRCSTGFAEQELLMDHVLGCEKMFAEIASESSSPSSSPATPEKQEDDNDYMVHAAPYGCHPIKSDPAWLWDLTSLKRAHQ